MREVKVQGTLLSILSIYVQAWLPEKRVEISTRRLLSFRCGVWGCLICIAVFQNSEWTHQKVLGGKKRLLIQNEPVSIFTQNRIQFT